MSVNGERGARPSRHDLRQFRAVMHGIEVNGAESASAKTGVSASCWARGYLAFVPMWAPEIAAKLREKHAGVLAP